MRRLAAGRGEPVTRRRTPEIRVLHLTPEFPPVIWGGLGTAVGGLANASAQAGMTVGVLLVGGVLVLGGAGLRRAPPTSRRSGATTGSRRWSEGGVVLPHPPGGALWRRAFGWPGHGDRTSSTCIRPGFGRSPPPSGGDRRTAGLHRPLSGPRRVRVRRGYQPVGDPGCGDPLGGSRDRDLAKRAGSAGPVPAEAHERVRLVGNGIDDCPEACEAGRKEAGSRAPGALHRAVRDRKGIRELLAAIPIVLDRHRRRSSCSSAAMGAGPRSNASGSPRFSARTGIGYTSRGGSPREVADWYRVADILVVPSWYEPFGMVILEGMLYGLPIAATAVGGPAEILEHGRTGILFPAKSVKALARALLPLVTDADLRQRIGAAAAEEVRRRWLWPHIVEKDGAYTKRRCTLGHACCPYTGMRHDEADGAHAALAWIKERIMAAEPDDVRGRP